MDARGKIREKEKFYLKKNVAKARTVSVECEWLGGGAMSSTSAKRKEGGEEKPAGWGGPAA